MNKKKIDLYQLNESVFRLLDKEWMLITAGKESSFNTMTASWGGFGILWNHPVAFIFIRPTRYTFEFSEKHEYFTLSFFEEKYRRALQYCGSHSGKDVDKMEATGLVPLETDKGNIFFEQARMVMECRKLFYEDLDPGKFIDEGLLKNYPKMDYHRMYIGKIENCWINEDFVE